MVFAGATNFISTAARSSPAWHASTAFEAAYRADIDAVPDATAKVAEITERLNRLRSPFRPAAAFWIEEIVDPRETRPWSCECARLAAPLRRPGPSAHGMRPQRPARGRV